MPPQVIERLEPRRLLAVLDPTSAVTATVDGDTLYVVGSTGDDRIDFEDRAGGLAVRWTATFDANGPTITASGVLEFDAKQLAGVGRLDVRTGEGDDTVIVGKVLNLPARIDGGDGDDLIAGGRADDLLLGGRGDDTLDGNYGVDTLYGGDGDDALYTGPTEVLVGDFVSTVMADVAYGGAGNDLAAAAGSTLITSGVETSNVNLDAVRRTLADDVFYQSGPDGTAELKYSAPSLSRPGEPLPGIRSAVGELVRTDDGRAGEAPAYAFEWRVTGPSGSFEMLDASPVDAGKVDFGYDLIDPTVAAAGDKTLVARRDLSAGFADGGGLIPTLNARGGVYGSGPPRIVGVLPPFDAEPIVGASGSFAQRGDSQAGVVPFVRDGRLFAAVTATVPNTGVTLKVTGVTVLRDDERETSLLLKVERVANDDGDNAVQVVYPLTVEASVAALDSIHGRLLTIYTANDSGLTAAFRGKTVALGEVSPVNDDTGTVVFRIDA